MPFSELMESFDLRDARSIVDLARQAEAAERYEDMCACMKKLVKLHSSKKESLTIDQRNYLSVAYKNVVGARRASLRALQACDIDADMLSLYKAQLQAELEDICQDILDILQKLIVEDDELDQDGSEGQVFYLKMAADYYRYLAECMDKDGTSYSDKCIEYYQAALQTAETYKMKLTHPIRLGLALNFSVALYEIKKDQKEACALAKEAFDKAISKLDQLEESDYKDSTLIMQLLRDNLTLWTNNDDADDDDEEN